MQKVCIIIPCYNEESRLPVSVFNDFYHQSESISFCFVNDGSTDNTKKVLNDLALGREDRIQILHLEKNAGKAEAVRHGILKCIKWNKFSFIGYFDADLSTPLSQIKILVDSLESKPESLIAFGSRVKLMGREIERNPTRHYFGRVFATLASMTLSLPVYDTQCGAKILKADTASEIFTKEFLSAWLFDVEILARIRNKFGKEKCKDLMVEVPLMKWADKGNSRIKFIDLVKVPYELLRIYLHYKV